MGYPSPPPTPPHASQTQPSHATNALPENDSDTEADISDSEVLNRDGTSSPSTMREVSPLDRHSDTGERSIPDDDVSDEAQVGEADDAQSEDSGDNSSEARSRSDEDVDRPDAEEGVESQTTASAMIFRSGCRRGLKRSHDTPATSSPKRRHKSDDNSP